MKIALVHPFAWPEVRRGGERYFDELTRYLRAQGHLVDMVVGTDGRTRTSPTEAGVDRRLHQLPSVQVRQVRLRAPETFGVRAYPTLVRHRYDVVHALVPSAAVAAKLAGQRTVLTLLGHPTEAALQRRPAQRRLLRAAFALVDEVTALSERVATDVEDALGRRPTVVPPGVRLSDYAPLERTAPPTILFASAMRPEKGVDVLLRAFALLGAERPEVRLVLCGPGDPRWAFDVVGAPLEAVIDRIEVAPPGDPADLPRRYAAAHVTVLPSRNEAFGLVLAESLASGTPVVGSAGGGADDIVTSEVGRIVDHGDAAGLARAMADVLDLAKDPATSARCLARAATWDWDARVGPAHEAVYRSILGTEALGR